MPRITDFCSCIYVFGCELSLVRLCNSDFGILLLCYRLIHVTKYGYLFLCCQFTLFILLTCNLLSPSFSHTWEYLSFHQPNVPRFKATKQMQNWWFIYLNLVFSHLELERKYLTAFELNYNKRLNWFILEICLCISIWLYFHRCCAINRKVAGSIPDSVIGIFHWHSSSDRTRALGSTQPLTEMSTRSISCG